MNEAERILTTFLRLYYGEYLSKSQLARDYGVSEKSIQRDFSFLDLFLEVQPYFSGELRYNSRERQRYLYRKSRFSKQEILVVTKILLENRAFNVKENHSLVDGLLDLLPKTDQKEIEKIIASEKLNYASLTDKQDRINKIWDFSEYIRAEKMVDFDYFSPYKKRVKKHTVLPVSIYYDEHYFYLKGYENTDEKYFDFRLDRIIQYKVSTAKKPTISHRDIFRDGDVRNYKVDAFTGEKITFRIFYSQDPVIILDKFSNSRIIRETDAGCEMLIESQNTLGLKRYLIGQLDELEVLSPPYLIKEIKETLDRMIKKY